jgi:phosphonate transport system substrate-binding protein
MNRLFLPLLLSLLVSAAMPLARADDQPNAGLVIGSVAMDIPAVMQVRLKPLTDYLGQELKRPVTLKLSPSLSAAARELAQGNTDLAYLTPVALLRAREEGGARVVVKTVTKGQGSFSLMVVTRGDAPIRSIADLAGKSFAFGDPSAVLQQAVVAGAGMPIESLGGIKFIGHYDNIARGVAAGDFDAGILKDTTAFQWQKKGLRVIYESPNLPPYCIAAKRGMDEKQLQAVRDALLKLNFSNPDHQRVIKALDESYDGFLPATEAEYDVVQKLIQPFTATKTSAR